ncbi:sulfate reduction electron transfer complex DsrMKJOP subunit DsrM [Thermodesulfobacterium hydrogeniphilum]|uniref:sulfate reduction electron transfer complex DsrMKJOP subunit DsrM n=1 Tax=Thermodesulfobacterium hydrogeniphilum TaxID=161156 RepID=UPI00056DF606|nr:sulfate reduction electron transfer complex DsrMKJOP subunit DsrM [Thermodesulfobacterium hydrogeniphilum]
MNVGWSLLAVIVLLLIPWIGVGVLGLDSLFGIVIPYACFLVFIIGLIYKMIYWAKSPQPFKIPTTCGQQKSLSWIKHSRLESPFTTWEVVLRMFFEIVFFRSLFRNLRAELQGRRLIYGSAKWLWLGAILFHWSFFIILLRHLRLFTNPVPEIIQGLDFMDSFLQTLGVPPVYITDVLIIAGLTFLLLRRLVDPKVSYLSHGSDYFPLFLILSIAITGVLMRYAIKVDIYGVKHLTLGLVTLKPTIPDVKIGTIFYIHIFLVSVLAAYFPFSKLCHMVGVFFSPTRNMANNNRYVRHVNPWDYPVKYTTYCEWQERFRDLLEQAGLPIDDEWCKEQQQTQKTQ